MFNCLDNRVLGLGGFAASVDPEGLRPPGVAIDWSVNYGRLGCRATRYNRPVELFSFAG